MQLKSKNMWLKTACILDYVFSLSNMGFLLEGRRITTARKVGFIWERVVCLDYHTKDVEMRSKKRPSFTCLKLPLAKNLEILEKRQKRKGEKYGPGGRRHCNPASKAQLVCLPSPACPAHLPWARWALWLRLLSLSAHPTQGPGHGLK